jgi:phospholipid/cholesterol/gamma-HCH transport system permease protein
MTQLDIQIVEDRLVPLAVLNGPLIRETVSEAFSRLKPYFERGIGLELDVGGVTRVDSSGVALIGYGLKRLGVGPGGCVLRSITAGFAENLKLAGWNFNAAGTLVADEPTPLLESVGGEVESAWEQITYFAYLVSEVFYQAVVMPFKGVMPKGKLFVEQMSRIGAGSAPIVLLVSFLVGLTTALQASYQLRQFGANIYVADLVGISMMRELGPLMAAIIVAGRSGAAITAEIGTMQVNEEIDALKLIGINPLQYLAVPRFYAVTLTQPMLGVMAAMIGIFGGFLIGLFSLDISGNAFLSELLSAIFMDDLIFNVYKSVVFGWIIVVVGVYYGLRVSGGAEGVGRATTHSVVTSIFLIIVADCVFSFI